MKIYLTEIDASFDEMNMCLCDSEVNNVNKIYTHPKTGGEIWLGMHQNDFDIIINNVCDFSLSIINDYVMSSKKILICSDNDVLNAVSCIMSFLIEYCEMSDDEAYDVIFKEKNNIHADFAFVEALNELTYSKKRGV